MRNDRWYTSIFTYYLMTSRIHIQPPTNSGNVIKWISDDVNQFDWNSQHFLQFSQIVTPFFVMQTCSSHRCVFVSNYLRKIYMESYIIVSFTRTIVNKRPLLGAIIYSCFLNKGNKSHKISRYAMYPYK